MCLEERGVIGKERILNKRMNEGENISHKWYRAEEAKKTIEKMDNVGVDTNRIGVGCNGDRVKPSGALPAKEEADQKEG